MILPPYSYYFLWFYSLYLSKYEALQVKMFDLIADYLAFMVRFPVALQAGF